MMQARRLVETARREPFRDTVDVADNFNPVARPLRQPVKQVTDRFARSLHARWNQAGRDDARFQEP